MSNEILQTHREMFEILLNGGELINHYNGKIMRLDENGNAILIAKNWHNFNPSDWRINKVDEKG